MPQYLQSPLYRYNHMRHSVAQIYKLNYILITYFTTSYAGSSNQENNSKG